MMNEMSQTVEELRTAAQALLSAADSLTRLLSDSRGDSISASAPESRPLANEPAENEPAQAHRPLTLEEVRSILSSLCAKGHGDKVKAMIEARGARRLKDIAPVDYDDLVLEAQALECEEAASNA